MPEHPAPPLGTILLCEIGSTGYGISIGGDDRDELGVMIEAPKHALGLEPIEHDIYRSAAVREGRQDAPSKPGDLDRTVYTLRKFARLAVKGNPSVMGLLFHTEQIIQTEWGLHLREEGPGMFLSQRVGRAFLGYMNDQRKRLEGKRGQRGVNRPLLVEQYGYDTKYAGHIVRLGLMGIELLDTGRVSVPLKEKDAELVRRVRRGLWSENQIIATAAEIEARLADLADRNMLGLPKEPDTGYVDAFVTEAYLQTWRRR
jgi:uncharacterized protein